MPVGRPRKDRFGVLADVPTIDADAKTKGIFDVVSSLEPLEDLWIDEWADRFFVLPRETSAEYGPWSTDRTPYLRRPLRCLSPQSQTKKVTMVTGTQLGKTTVGLIWSMYSAERNPGPGSYIRETEDAAIEFSQEKYKPTSLACPCLHSILGTGRPKGLTFTDTNKHYPGGFTIFGSVGSVINLVGKSLRDVICDEVDEYQRDVRGRGSVLDALGHRQDTFSAIKKMLLTSVPKIKETSLIWPLLEQGTNERFYLPCPICNPDNWVNRRFKIEFEDIKFSKDNLDPHTGYPIDVWLQCPHCGEQIDEKLKTWMLLRGTWMARDPNGELYEPGDQEHVSFRLPSFYSPLGFFSWHDAVRAFFDYKRSLDPLKLQAFENQICAKTYSLAGKDINDRALASHVEEYINEETGEVVDAPAGVLAITMGADVQGDRIECEVVGWGLFGESWSLDYQIYRGNTEFIGDRNYRDPTTDELTPWGLFDQYHQQRFRHASGRMLSIECTLIDANYRAEPVNAYCKENEGRRIYPVIGKARWGKGFIVRPKKRNERWGTWTVFVNTYEIKDCLYQWFSLDNHGPGYCHFPNKPFYDSKYFKGLTCENRETKLVGGVKQLYFKNPSGARNEPFDVRVYAFAALEFSGINLQLRARQKLVPSSAPRPAASVKKQGQRRRQSRVLSPGI